MEKIPVPIRWLLTSIGPFVAVFLVSMPIIMFVQWITMLSTGYIENYWWQKLFLNVLIPFISGYVFVYSASYFAPAQKFIVSIIALILICIFNTLGLASVGSYYSHPIVSNVANISAAGFVVYRVKKISKR